MILPEDTKAPIPSDDEEYEDDFASLPPSPSPDRNISFPQDQYGSHNYDYPASPNSAITHPLLLFPDEDDIELGPAPPYTPHDPQRRIDRKGQLGKTVGRRFILGVAGALGLWVGIMGLSAIGWGIWGRHPPHPNHPGDGDGQPGDGGGGGPPQGPGMPYNGRFDGEPVECVNFTPESSWSPFPLSNDQPHLPDSLDAAKGSRRSTNSTFIVPTHDNDVFAHLMIGPAAIGDFFVDTYDADSDVVYEEVKNEDNIVQRSPEGDLPRKGEYVRITVESIYDVLPEIGEAVATDENSPGWEMLLSSKVCLMDRGTNVTQSPEGPGGPPGPDEDEIRKRSNKEAERHPRPPRPVERSSGVGIYTAHPANSIYANLSDASPLQFRFHIAVPSSITAKQSSLVDSIFDTLSLAPPPDKRPPRNFVPSLEIRGGSSNLYVGNLTEGVDIRHFSLGSGFGEIHLEDLKAGAIDLKTMGKIEAKVAVSMRLDVETPIGDIDLDVSLNAAPPFLSQPHFPPPPPGPGPGPNMTTSSAEDFPPPPPPPTPEGPGNACDFPPVQVSVRAGNDMTTVRYTGWEKACLGLNQDLVSLTGPMKIYAHPLFQGSYKLNTATGPISVDLGTDLPDPEGMGRWRNITLQQRERPGSKFWSGQVTWEESSSSGSSSGQEEEEEEIQEGEDQDVSRSPRPPPPPFNRRTERVISARSSVGGIDLIF